MPRQLRIEYPGAIYHVMSRGDRREDIFLGDVDRQDFLKTLAEACEKTGWLVLAYCLMRNHFHLVIETPQGNLVAGMRWLLSTYTLRLNHRHRLAGHVFGGRYKALVVDGSGNGYLKRVCDYVHLNPVRAKILGPEERLRVERLFGEHGIGEDTARGREEFERRLETRRAQENDAEWAGVRRGWCLGSEEFRRQMLERIGGRLRDHHGGQLRQESAEGKAEGIIAAELSRLGWGAQELGQRRKSDPAKLALAARLRRETTLTLKWIAARLNLGTWKSARVRLNLFERAKEKDSGKCYNVIV